jgi:hypothetical protein
MPAELATTLATTEAERLLQAEALVRSYCGWHIAPSRADVEETLAGSGASPLFLRSLYVTAIASVVDDGTALAVTDDYLWKANGEIRRAGYWGTGDVVVTYTHGYAEPPAEVTAVVQAIAQRAVQNPGSIVRQQVGQVSDTYSQSGFNQSLPMALLDAEKEILDAYRIARVS